MPIARFVHLPVIMAKTIELLCGRQSEVRKIIKDRRTTITKSRKGNLVGGNELIDITLQPHIDELEMLKAKIAKSEETMSTTDRAGDAAEEVMVDAAQNKNEVIQALD